jgi:hypothetical protein
VREFFDYKAVDFERVALSSACSNEQVVSHLCR